MELEVTDIAETAESDGSIRLRLKDTETGEFHFATVPEPFVTNLVGSFQRATLAAATEGTIYAHLPELTVKDANAMHRPQESEVSVSIDQMGWVVLRCSDTLLHHLKAVIDRVLTFRGQPSAKQ